MILIVEKVNVDEIIYIYTLMENEYSNESRLTIRHCGGHKKF
jgi:hypothetical protein